MSFLDRTLAIARHWLKRAFVAALVAPVIAMWLEERRGPLARLGLALGLFAALVLAAAVAVVLWAALVLVAVLGLTVLLLLSAAAALYLRFRGGRDRTITVTYRHIDPTSPGASA